MKVLENIKEVFNICSKFTDQNLKDDYMYMYTDDNNHYFKHIVNRNSIKIEVNAFNRSLSDYIEDIELEVIATYNISVEQDFLNIYLTKDCLETEKHLIKYIKGYLEYPDNLAKLSLCFICDKNMIDKYKTIQDSLIDNGKYYFNENGEIIR